jgi:hypothetical protein
MCCCVDHPVSAGCMFVGHLPRQVCYGWDGSNAWQHRLPKPNQPCICWLTACLPAHRSPSGTSLRQVVMAPTPHQGISWSRPCRQEPGLLWRSSLCVWGTSMARTWAASPAAQWLSTLIGQRHSSCAHGECACVTGWAGGGCLGGPYLWTTVS